MSIATEKAMTATVRRLAAGTHAVAARTTATTMTLGRVATLTHAVAVAILTLATAVAVLSGAFLPVAAVTLVDLEVVAAAAAAAAAATDAALHLRPILLRVASELATIPIRDPHHGKTPILLYACVSSSRLSHVLLAEQQWL